MAHHHTGRPLKINLRRLKRLVEENPYRTSRSLAVTLRCSHPTALRGLKRLGYKSVLGRIVSHHLSFQNKANRVAVCEDLLRRFPTPASTNKIVTCDEKQCGYDNPIRCRQWARFASKARRFAKADLHPKQALLSVFWGSHGIYVMDFQPPRTTITADVFVAQISEVAKKLHDIPSLRPPTPVAWLHDNATPHTAEKTKQKLASLHYTLLLHAA